MPVPVPEPTDAALAGRVVHGDTASFEELIYRHHTAVWRVAFLSARDEMTAEELTQDTFLRAYSALGQWRGEASLRSWLCTICRRLCIDHARRKRLTSVPLQEVGDVAEGRGARGAAIDQVADEVVGRIDLDRHLEALPDDEREAFLLVHHFGHSSFEAAEILEIPASTLRSRVGRARQRLAEGIAASGGPTAGEESG